MDRVELTREIIEELKYHRDRTGIGSLRLLRMSGSEKPDHLTHSIVKNWLHGSNKTVKESDLEHVLHRWRRLPDCPYGTRVVILPKIRKKLKFYRNKTNVGAVAILRGKHAEKPRGLNSNTINLWLTGEAMRANQKHLDFVLELWEAIYTENKVRVEIKKSFVKKLIHHRNRTGVGVLVLLQGAQEKTPDKLSVAIVYSWISYKTEWARQDHLDFVIKEWERLPDKITNNSLSSKKQKYPQNTPGRPGLIKLSHEQHNDLRNQRIRTGVSGAALLKNADPKEIPHGITAERINTILQVQTEWAEEEYFDFLNTEYERIKPHLIIVPENTVAKLHKHKERTAIEAADLLKISPEPPKGLRAIMIVQWMNGINPSAHKKHLSWTLKAWKSLPDANS